MKRFALVFVLNAAVFAVFLALGPVLELLEIAPGVSLWYSASGIALAFLVRFGWRVIPAVILGHALTDFWTRNLITAWPLTVGLAIVLTLLYGTAAIFLKRRSLKGFFNDTQGMRLFLTTAFALAFISGGITSVTLAAAHSIPWSRFGWEWRNFALSEILGLLLLTPWLLPLIGHLHGPVISPYNRSSSQPWLPFVISALKDTARSAIGLVWWKSAKAWLLDTLLLIAAMGMALWLGFFSQLTGEFPLFYICFLPLLWITMRRGLRGTLIAIALTYIGVLLVMRGAHFSLAIVDDLQIFLLTLTVTGLALGALVSERVTARLLAQSRGEWLDALRRLQFGTLRDGLSEPLLRRFVETLRRQTDAGWAVAASFKTQGSKYEALLLAATERSAIGEKNLEGTLESALRFTLKASVSTEWIQACLATHPTHLAGPIALLNGKILPGPVLIFPLVKGGEPLGFVMLGEGALSQQKLEARNLRTALSGLNGVMETDRQQRARKSAEAQVRERELDQVKAERIEAVGRLAGGIAQDFNNLLTTIGGHAQMLLENPELQVHTNAIRSLQKIRSAEQRAASLTQHLLAFSKQEIFAPTLFDLNESLRELEWTLASILALPHRIQFDLCDSPVFIKADPQHLVRIVVNLAFNAREAMPPTGGTLTIRTQKSNAHSDLILTDNGKGMPAHVLARAFEPFFTTQAEDSHRGLGLSVALGLVQENGGAITLWSEPDQGTEVRMRFPLSFSKENDTDITYFKNTPLEAPTLLLVEDDDSVRDLLVHYLRDRGYNLLVACDGLEALLASRHYAGIIDLLLTDIVMPNMGGIALSEELEELRPGIHVLYMSGYCEDEAFKNRLREGKAQFLAKPFSPRLLVQRIEALVGPGIPELTAATT